MSLKVMFEQRPGESEWVISAGVWGKSIPGRASSKCKGLDVGAGLLFEEHQKAREAGVGCSRKKWWEIKSDG